MSFFQTCHEIAQTAMPIFCPKNGNSLKNAVLLSFFQTFHEIAPTAMPIFGPKTVHYVPKSH